MARPHNWKSLAPHPPPSTPTFAKQASLPRLPVLPLGSTLDRLKASIKPLATDEKEFAVASRKIEEFGNGFGKVLQKRLQERAEEPGREHWLEDWWDDGGYLKYRDSVVVNVSYYYGFAPQPKHLKQTATARAAAITRSALLFRKQLKQGLVEPDATKADVLCMDTWRWMFDCCRVPAIPADWSVTYAKEGDTGDSGHVIVLRKGRVWKVPAVNVDGRLLSTADWEQQFQYIYDSTTEEYPGVGVLTASNRDIWAEDYVSLARDPKNEAIIREIHSSAFVVCLDTETPETPVEFSRALWLGGVNGGMMGNRWVDKPCQFVIFDNAKAGFMGEHSVMDGTPTARMTDEVVEALHSESFDHGSLSTVLSVPQPLDWVITPPLEHAMSAAKKATHELVTGQTLNFLLTPYGKAAIKKFGCSPDSWAQMVIQLAYARLLRATQGKEIPNGGTYEAASTRRFHKGRTETIRVVTEESIQWVKSMDDPKMSKDDRRMRFQQATAKHNFEAKEAGKAQGIDRHLFGLRNLVQEGEAMPELFADPLVSRSSYWVLSTSAIFSKHFDVYGWGEVVPDGFGVAYVTGFDDRLQFTVTSRNEMPNDKFIKELARAAKDLYDLHAVDKAKL